jgi:hypothetical protein
LDFFQDAGDEAVPFLTQRGGPATSAIAGLARAV